MEPTQLLLSFDIYIYIMIEAIYSIFIVCRN